MPNKLKNIFAYLIGLFCMTDILYLFKYNTTFFSIGSIISLIFNIITFLFFCNTYLKVLKKIPIDLILFICAIFLSLFSTLVFSSLNVYRWFTGVITFSLSFAVIISVLILNKNMDYLMKGISTGVLINSILVFVELFFYLQGQIFVLSDYIPTANIAPLSIYNSFRGKGLFSEPGHLARCFTILSLVLFSWNNKIGHKAKSFFYLGLMSVIIILASSSSLIIYCVELIVFLFVSKNKKKRNVFLFFTVLIFIVLFLLFIYIFDVKPVLNVINVILSDINDMLAGLSSNPGSSDQSRRQGMRNGIEIIKMYPVLGVGWNSMTYQLQRHGFYTNEIRAAYSGLINYFADLGLGAFFFLSFVVRIIYSFLFCNPENDILKKSLGVSLCGFLLLFISTTFDISSLSVPLLFGLSICNLEEKTSRQVVKHKNSNCGQSFNRTLSVTSERL